MSDNTGPVPSTTQMLSEPVTDFTPTIYAILPRIIGDMEGIGKNQRNKEQGYSFRGIDDVMKALHPLLAKHGAFIVPDVVERQYEERRTKSGTIMHTVHLHTRFRVYGPRGDYIEGSTWGEGTDAGDKSSNKAATASLKYFLFPTFAISDPRDDADASSPEDTVSRRNSRQKAVDPDTGEIQSERKLAAPDVMDALKARIAGLDDTQKAELLAEWKQSKIGKIGQLTADEATAVGKLIDKVIAPADTPVAEGPNADGDDPATSSKAQPEPSAVEDPNASTPKQWGMIHALAREQGWSDDATEMMLSEHIGREITSTKQLTKREASEIISWLELEGTN